MLESEAEPRDTHQEITFPRRLSPQVSQIPPAFPEMYSCTLHGRGSTAQPDSSTSEPTTGTGLGPGLNLSPRPYIPGPATGRRHEAEKQYGSSSTAVPPFLQQYCSKHCKAWQPYLWCRRRCHCRCLCGSRYRCWYRCFDCG